MRIVVPDTIAHLEPLLVEFVGGMVHKLHVNSHKDSLTTHDVPALLDRMVEEMQEFKDQLLADRTDLNALAETWDSSNFWFLIYAALRSEGVATQRERFLDEFYDINTDLGRIYCAKTRSGSKYRLGDEVKGTLNAKGEVMIRAQDAAGGVSVNLRRADIVWWKATGQWPGDVEHHNRGVRQGLGDEVTEDALANLFRAEGSPGVKYPYVSQYKPAGREGSSNYGRWCYQRRHAFRLVRVGYWDTAAEAAVEGLKQWKEKVSNV